MPCPSAAQGPIAARARGPGRCFRAVANLYLRVLQPLPRDVWSLSLFPFQLANGGNKSRAGRFWTALQMPSELAVLALTLVQGSLGARGRLSAAGPLQRDAQLCPPGEVNPSPQPAAQIPMSSPQPLGPQAHQEVQLPREMPLHIILKETAAQGHASQPFLPQPLVARSLGRKRPDWAQAYDHISVLLTEHTARLMLMGTGAVSAGTPSCSVGGLP